MSVLTKRQAVCAMLERAMVAFDEGDHASALTLAGAAEEAMPPADHTAFQVMRSAFAASEGGLAAAGRMLNKERNWLKHYNPDEPTEIDLKSSLMMIIRACSHFHVVYGIDAETVKMAEFWALARAFDPDD